MAGDGDERLNKNMGCNVMEKGKRSIYFFIRQTNTTSKPRLTRLFRHAIGIYSVYSVYSDITVFIRK